jgi:hypothetical protein
MVPKFAKMLKIGVKYVVLPLKIVSTISNQVLAPFIGSQRFRPIKFHHFAQTTNEKIARKKKMMKFFQ